MRDVRQKRCVDDEFSDVDDDDESFYESHYGSHTQNPCQIPQKGLESVHYSGNSKQST